MNGQYGRSVLVSRDAGRKAGERVRVLRAVTRAVPGLGIGRRACGGWSSHRPHVSLTRAVIDLPAF